MNLIFVVLLIIHILCGSISLLSALGAMLCKKGFHWHRVCGRFFIGAMTGVFITAVPLSIIKHNLFLFLIAFFSYYLAFTGWRFAKNRTGVANNMDWFVSLLMLAIGMMMISLGIHHFDQQNYQKIVLIVFGAIGTLISISGIKIYLTKKATGIERIIKHFTGMLGATIAATTAFAVTNIHTGPALAVWLGPTIAITPIIIWWKYKARTMDGLKTL